jgi:hypothetical protein
MVSFVPFIFFCGFIHFVNHFSDFVHCTHLMLVVQPSHQSPWLHPHFGFSNGLVHYVSLVFLVVLSTMLNLGGLCFDGSIHTFHVCCLVQCSF